MDIRLLDQDLAFDAAGTPLTVSGIEETAQRVRIACEVEKGSFAYDRRLGMDRDGLDREKILSGEPRAVGRLGLLIREAVIDIPDTEVEVLAVREMENGLTATLEVRRGGQITTTEVAING